MHTLSYFILLMILAVPTHTIAKVYKWVDEQGITHFSDEPPANHIDSQEIKIQSTNVADAYQPKQPSSMHKKQNSRQKSKDDCWKQGNSLGFMLAAADNLSGKEKADYIKLIKSKKKALEKECGKNSNAWSN